MAFVKASRKKKKLRLALEGPSGSGKAQPLDAPVLTPSGWNKIGNLNIGDKIIDPDGGIAEVTGLFPQGKKEVFLVNFSDGSSTECCKDHLWLTETVLDRGAYNGNGRPGTVKSLAEIKETLFYKEKYNHYIPNVKNINFTNNNPLPIHPYLFGVILGDGSTRSGSVTISNTESDIINKVTCLVPDGISLKKKSGSNIDYNLNRTTISGENVIVNVLRELQLMGCLSIDKFIPEIYKFTSFNDRLDLLKGLLDTDGHVSKSGTHVEYTTSSSKLAYDVRELAQSLGFVVSMKSRVPNYTYKGEKKLGHLNFRLNIMFNNDTIPVSSEKHLNKIKLRTKYQPTRKFLSIEPNGKKECICISVNSKRNLYITNDFIVTHNTMTALKIAKYLVPGGRVAVIDTERSSSELYADEPELDVAEFDVENLTSFSPENYIKAIKNAESEGYDVLIIDSFTHAWAGKDGALEMAENAGRKFGENRFTAWRTVTPAHNSLVDAILDCKCHVIVTMRTKSEYVLEEGTNAQGKTVTKPKKVGTKPIMREGTEYELDVVGDMTIENDLIIDKTRCPRLAGKVFNKPGEDLAKILREWLNKGEESKELDPPSQQEILLSKLGVVSSKEDLAELLTEIIEIKKTGIITDAENKVLLKAYKDAEKRVS